MNNFTEQQINDKLKQLASIKPSEDSNCRINQNIRNLIVGMGRKPAVSYHWRYCISAAAAVLLIGIGLFNTHKDQKYVPVDKHLSSESRLTLAKLNAVVRYGGQQGLNEYLDKIESNRQPRAEKITLQDLMKEL